MQHGSFVKIISGIRKNNFPVFPENNRAGFL
jgi:hypothetical protein